MKDRKRFFSTGILILLLIFGLCHVGEAGVCFDEEKEREILSMNLLQYGDFFHMEQVSSHFRGRGLIPISESVERDHGIAPYYLFAPALGILEGRTDLLSHAWHFYTYLLFFLGVVYLYRLLYDLFHSRKTALLGAAVLFLTPRIFADGLYNNKDIVLLSLVIVMLFYGIRFLDRRDFKSALLLGVSAGFAGNLKISGIYVFALIGLFYVLELTFRKKWSLCTFCVGAAAAGTGFLSYLALTPAIWGQGFQLVEFIRWNLVNAANFSRLDGTVLFEGHVFRHSAEPLPWYYLPKIMALTLPFYVTILIAGSLFLWIGNLKKRRRTERLYPLFLLTAVIPITVAMVSAPNIYNGWRHFYFLYGPLVILAAYTLSYVFQMEKWKKPALLGVCLLLLYNGMGIAKNGIFSTGYVNFLAGKSAEGKYELDYYGAATKKILTELVNRYEKIYIYPDSKGSVIVNYRALSAADRNKIVIVHSEEEARRAEKESAAEENTAFFYFVNTSYDEPELKGREPAYEYESWGNTIVKLYGNEKGNQNQRFSEF